MLKQKSRRRHCTGQQQRKISTESIRKEWPPVGEGLEKKRLCRSGHQEGNPRGRDPSGGQCVHRHDEESMIRREQVAEQQLREGDTWITAPDSSSWSPELTNKMWRYHADVTAGRFTDDRPTGGCDQATRGAAEGSRDPDGGTARKHAVMTALRPRRSWGQ